MMGRLLVAVFVLANWVSIDASAEVLDLPVPSQVIYPGETIQKDHVISKPFEVNDVAKRNFATTVEQMTGKEARRTLLPGKPVALSALGLKLIVKRGNSLRVQFRDAGLEITALLIALQDGYRGDVIKAKNPESGQIVRVNISDESAGVVVFP